MLHLADLLRFPCDDAKRPMMPAWQRNAGRFDHSRWPLVGVPTGEANGFDVVDVDVEGLAWWERNQLPQTQVHRTRSGGLHLLFKHARGLRCSAGRIAPGVDVRADGGFVVWWPREGFACEERELAEWPDWLLVLAEKRRPETSLGTSEPTAPYVNHPSSHVGVMGVDDDGATFDVRRRSKALVRKVEATPRGERNRVLNWAAFRFGGMIAEGIIERGVAERLLEGAAKANKLWREDGAAQCSATIRSGIEAGMAGTGDGGFTHGANGTDLIHRSKHPSKHRTKPLVRTRRPRPSVNGSAVKG